jgi:hypothetical protein
MANHIEEIGNLVVKEAQERFRQCGAGEDFCIQAVSDDAVIFGKENRVVYNPETGWIPAVGFCTDRFAARWDHKYPNWM